MEEKCSAWKAYCNKGHITVCFQNDAQDEENSCSEQQEEFASSLRSLVLHYSMLWGCQFQLDGDQGFKL